MLLSLPIVAQNLVKNPSFETYSNCPQTLGTFESDVTDWKTPTLGSTDYFNGCSTVMGTPKNFNGEQPADFGTGYIGLYFYAPDDYREYVEASLNSVLEKGKTYTLSFYVSLAERSDFAIREFSAVFSENPIFVNTRKNLSRMHLSRLNGDISNRLEIRYSDFYSDEKDWVLVKKEFVAKGTEKYMIIGNFKNNQRTRKFSMKRNSTKGSYYYLDMVSVTASPSGNSEKNITAKKTTSGTPVFTVNTVAVFNHVLFDFDQSELLPSALKELETIQTYMLKNKHLKIDISGHTDNIGGETYNKRLSTKRAAEVAAYLMRFGISENRISWKGYGSSKPLVKNDTDANRKRNRRVEFVFTDQ
ncbi:OmpA family protein [Maribacter sp. 2210JD10-5]|uniref:OmpA family protein n=1 Tax=Maribacter sp. 2210JD10-5 TaxID=3386272 RepID=UPI0039BD28EE